MKIRPLASIPTSACLTALLALSANATAGTMNYPVSAQKAYQTAVSGLDASGWPAAAAAMSVSQPMPTMTTGTTPKADPVMTEELMARLIKYSRDSANTGGVDQRVCKVLGLCDGTEAMPLKLAEAENATDGSRHFFGISPKADSTDILFMLRHPGGLDVYLTDKTGKIRAAARMSGGVAILIDKGTVTEQYKKELSLFAAEAAGLPPTGTAVAGNS